MHRARMRVDTALVKAAERTALGPGGAAAPGAAVVPGATVVPGAAVGTSPAADTEPAAAGAGRMRWWHLGVAAGSLLTAGTVLASAGPAAAALALVPLGALVGGWAWFGRRALDGGPRWRAFLALVVAVGLAGAAIDPAFAAFQLLAFPLVWSVAPRLPEQVAANLALGVAVGIGYAVSTTRPLLAIAVQSVSLLFSFVMGFWISYYARLAEEREALIGRLTATQDALAALSRERGVASERERLSRELHDTIAQSLTAIVMLAERAKGRYPADTSLAVLEESAREALAETRGLVAATASVPLEGGLATAMTRLGERFERETGVRVTTEVRAEVPRGLEVVLLRCAQEGLANVRKHAGATAVAVRVGQRADAVELVVEDDGTGVAADADDRGFGLAGMRDRVALVGGELTLDPGDEHGTCLTVRVPVDAPTVAP